MDATEQAIWDVLEDAKTKLLALVKSEPKPCDSIAPGTMVNYIGGGCELVKNPCRVVTRQEWSQNAQSEWNNAWIQAVDSVGHWCHAEPRNWNIAPPSPKFKVGDYVTCPASYPYTGIVYRIVGYKDGFVKIEYRHDDQVFHAADTPESCLAPYVPVVGEEVWVDGKDDCNRVVQKAGRVTRIIKNYAWPGADYEIDNETRFSLNELRPLSFAPQPSELEKIKGWFYEWPDGDFMVRHQVLPPKDDPGWKKWDGTFKDGKPVEVRT